MSTFDLVVSVPVETHVCTNPDCESEFSILFVQRPAPMYLKENPHASTSWSEWASKSELRPFCPNCGKRILKPEENKDVDSRSSESKQYDSLA